MKKTMKKTAHIITICDDLGEKYRRYFGKPYSTVLTGSSFPAGTLPRVGETTEISYIGNFGLDRWKSLLDIEAAVEEIARESKTPYRLTYYGEKHPCLQGKVAYGGKLNEAQVREVMGKSALLLHTETFERAFRERLRYSLSTKLADCLASGVCLFAYAPDEIASMHHLAVHRAAVLATDPTMLKDRLKAALTDRALIEATEQNAIETARLCHNSIENSKRLYALLRTLTKRDPS